MLKPVSKEARWIFGAALTTLGYIYLMSFRSPIIVDFGVLIDRTWRIYLGQVPCRDFYCPSTPLTYWIQALLFKSSPPGMFPRRVILGNTPGEKILKRRAWIQYVRGVEGQ